MKRIARSVLVCTIAGCGALGLLATPANAAGEIGVASVFTASFSHSGNNTYAGTVTISGSPVVSVGGR